MFTCEMCKYTTSVKCNYNKHLTTKKHLRNVELIKTNKVCLDKMSTNEHKMSTNEHKDIKETKPQFICEYCDRKFTTKPIMRRHQLHYCKGYAKELCAEDNLRKELKEKKLLYEKIEKLLEENGRVINSNNTINNNLTNNIHQTNNIVINNYGDEDVSHITQNVLEKLMAKPADMINNLTKMIHFNKNKPENMNMYIPSRKQKFIKVFKKNKWVLEKKNETIPDLVDRNYTLIDSYYEDCGGSDKLNKETNKNYKNYQKLIDNKNEKVIRQEYDSCELAILNNSEMVMDQHHIPH